MALMPIQVLIYSLALTGKVSVMECELKANKSVTCTNGITAVEARTGGGMIMTVDGKETVAVQTGKDGQLLFSNGITAIRLPSGWIKFSTGIEWRPDTGGVIQAFLVAPDWICSEAPINRAVCRKK
jgi:hypothetical protein